MDKLFTLTIILVVIIGIFAAILGSGVISQIFQNTDSLEELTILLLALIESEKIANIVEQGNMSDLRLTEEISDRGIINEALNISKANNIKIDLILNQTS